MGLTAWAQEEKAKHEAWSENTKLEKRIAELEKERSDLLAYYHDAMRWFSKHDPNAYISPKYNEARIIMDTHNLRQQAKGIEDAVEYVGGSMGECLGFAEILNKQADELEEGND